jgi:hypothetical protein
VHYNCASVMIALIVGKSWGESRGESSSDSPKSPGEATELVGLVLRSLRTLYFYVNRYHTTPLFLDHMSAALLSSSSFVQCILCPVVLLSIRAFVHVSCVRRADVRRAFVWHPWKIRLNDSSGTINSRIMYDYPCGLDCLPL